MTDVAERVRKQSNNSIYLVQSSLVSVTWFEVFITFIFYFFPFGYWQNVGLRDNSGSNVYVPVSQFRIKNCPLLRWRFET
jgi:hypothetical protein